MLRSGKPNGETGQQGGGPNSKDERVPHAIGKEDPKSDSLHGFPDSDPIIQVTEIEFCEDKPDTATSNAEAIVAPFTEVLRLPMLTPRRFRSRLAQTRT